MSRRLENIQTGFVDYSKMGEGFNQAFVQGKKIQWEEEDRQRRIQQEEDARLAAGAQLYAGWMDEVNKMENGLDPQAREKFVEQFNGIKDSYRGIQEAISKGVKVGTPQYYTLFNQVTEKKNALLKNIGLVKQLNESTDQLVKNYAGGLITSPDVQLQIENQRKAIFQGSYQPSMGLVTPQQVVANSHKSAYSVIKGLSSVLPVTMSQDADYGKDGKTVIKTQRIVPSFSGSISAIDSFLSNASPVETRDITNQLNKFKSDPNAAEKSNYKYYMAYMNTDAVKADPMYSQMGIKKPEDFTETDFALMESLPSKFKPNFKEMETMAPKGGKSSISKETQIKLDNMFANLWSGDANKRDKEIDKVSGALQTTGWNVTRAGTKLTAVKGADKLNPFSKTIKYEIDFSQNNPKNTAASQAMLKDYGIQVQGF